MNYLSHHHVARRLAGADAPPAFYIGNVLPDLLAASGEGRLRAIDVPAAPGPGQPDPELARGLALHLDADRRFHAAPEFAAAQAGASALLRGAPFSRPPRRVFFLAHVFVELALDAALLREDRTVADHFYAQFARADLVAIASGMETMLGRPLPRLAGSLARFAGARYLYDYATADGLVEAMRRVCARAGLEDFPLASDRAALAAQFARFAPEAEALGPRLWDRGAGA